LILRALGVGILMACGQPLWTPPPVVRPLSSRDHRRAFVGTWRTQFTFDSVRQPVRETPSSIVTTPLSGTLNAFFRISDTLVDREGKQLASTWQFDSTKVPLIPWPFRDSEHAVRAFPLSPGVHTTVVEHHGARVTLDFHAPCGDCGSPNVAGTYSEDSIVGTWRAASFGIGVFGRVRMVRVAATDSEWRLPNKRLEPAPPFSNGRIVFVNTRMLRRGSAAGR